MSNKTVKKRLSIVSVDLMIICLVVSLYAFLLLSEQYVILVIVSPIILVTILNYIKARQIFINEGSC